MKAFFTSRKFRQGSMATAITVVVVAILILLNFLATGLTDRYNLTLDLTPNKLFSITDETKQFLHSLDKDVTIQIMSREDVFVSAGGEYYQQANEVIKKIAGESDHIEVVYRDLISDPTIAQEYPTLQLNTSSILISCGDKVRDVTPYQLYDIESTMYGGYVTASKAEQVLASAILAVTSENTINVAVLTGHEEEDVSSFTTLLTSNNYMVEEKSVVTEEIDPAYNIAIIAAPRRDYSEEELKRLDKFLKNDGQYGKTLLYFSSSDQTDLPNLDAFLADWGIGIGAGMVYETDNTKSFPGNPFIAVIDYAEAEYAGTLISQQVVPLTAYARPMDVLFETKSGIKTTTLLEFSETSGILTGQEDEELKASGPHPYMIMGQSLTYDGSTPLISQVVAAGSSAIIDRDFLAQASLANSEYMLGLLAELTGKEDSLTIQSKAIGVQPLNISQSQAYTFGVIFVVVFPLVVLVSGIVIWARRRHR